MSNPWHEIIKEKFEQQHEVITTHLNIKDAMTNYIKEKNPETEFELNFELQGIVTITTENDISLHLIEDFADEFNLKILLTSRTISENWITDDTRIMNRYLLQAKIKTEEED